MTNKEFIEAMRRGHTGKDFDIDSDEINIGLGAIIGLLHGNDEDGSPNVAVAFSCRDRNCHDCLVIHAITMDNAWDMATKMIAMLAHLGHPQAQAVARVVTGEIN